MIKEPDLSSNQYIKRFDRSTFSGAEEFTFIGDGRLGGKALRFALIIEKIVTQYRTNKDFPITVNIPRLTVITTECFDLFLEQNNLYDTAFSTRISDKEKAKVFLQADLPQDLTEDLQAYVKKIRTPLAVRSSSLMEDSLDFPFAGIYQTKMIPNNQRSSKIRLRILSDAIKLIYASTFFINARCAMKASSINFKDEKMAVIIQEVVGLQHHNRFYPNISGVARSYNFYPTGHSKPEDGVVSLALGLGKAIVEGGTVWTYSPEYPEVNPPYDSINQMLEQTQLDFWAVNMGKLPTDNPLNDSEYLVRLTIKDAEKDNTLGYIASTYDFESDRINIGIGFGGSRIINFAPLLQVDLLPVNQLIKSLLKICEKCFGSKVEMEFAVTFEPGNKLSPRFALLQIRPMRISRDEVEVNESLLTPERVFAYSDNVMGNGNVGQIKDIVYVKPETFDHKNSAKIAHEIETFNHKLVSENRQFLLLGFGRWGSSNPWWGIPVNWGQICGAKVIVESTIPGTTGVLSQGSHFFHNMTNLKILYFSIKEGGKYPIDWNWLKKQEVINEGKYVNHVRLTSPLTIKADGRKRKGIILK